ncbi:MAG: response regulator transcription factor [Solirubrobacteraceae bacterium]
MTGAVGPGEPSTAPAARLRVVVVDDHHLFRAGGDAYFSPRLAAFVLQEFSAPETRQAQSDASLEALTPREREVLHHLARGYSYKRIGQRLDISPRTVESHVGAVLRKLQLTSRHEVTHWAAARGLIEPDDADTT